MFSPRTPLIAALLLCPLLAASTAHAQSPAQTPTQIAQTTLPDAPSAHLAADLRPDISIPVQSSQQAPPAGTQSLPPSAKEPATSPAHNTPSATDESNKPPQTYNLHAQYTFTGMAYPSFTA